MDSPVALMKFLFCLFCFAVAVSSTRALTEWDPPACQQSYVTDGNKSYDDIANIFFPDAVINRGTPEAYNYRYVEFQKANVWANISDCQPYASPSSTPRIPNAGQTILVPPCTWAEGCRAVVPLNQTYGYEDAVRDVIGIAGNGSEVDLDPYIYSTGNLVGPGENAYVLPCNVTCCKGSPSKGTRVCPWTLPPKE